MTALGFDEYMAVNALKMTNFNYKQAIECLLTNPTGLFEYMEVKN